MKTKSLEQYRQEFKQKKLITTPLAGMIVWAILGTMSLFIPAQKMVLPFYIGTGSIFYLALFISKFTGEKLIAKKGEMNPFDSLFLYTVVMSLMCFAIVVPFIQENHLALPMAIGIISGLMWLPISWTLEHKVGIYHTVSRTLSLVLVWYIAPEQSFVLVPFIIVIIYLFSIYALYKRWQNENKVTLSVGKANNFV